MLDYTAVSPRLGGRRKSVVPGQGSSAVLSAEVIVIAQILVDVRTAGTRARR